VSCFESIEDIRSSMNPALERHPEKILSSTPLNINGTMCVSSKKGECIQDDHTR
jgi:hypothetical protein